MDVDHSKYLSLKEFSSGLKDFGLNLPESSVKELFKYIDKDGQNGITFDEFLQALRVNIVKIEHLRTLSIEGFLF